MSNEFKNSYNDPYLGEPEADGETTSAAGENHQADGILNAAEADDGRDSKADLEGRTEHRMDDRDESTRDTAVAIMNSLLEEYKRNQAEDRAMREHLDSPYVYTDVPRSEYAAQEVIDVYNEITEQIVQNLMHHTGFNPGSYTGEQYTQWTQQEMAAAQKLTNPGNHNLIYQSSTDVYSQGFQENNQENNEEEQTIHNLGRLFAYNEIQATDLTPKGLERAFAEAQATWTAEPTEAMSWNSTKRFGHEWLNENKIVLDEFIDLVYDSKTLTYPQRFTLVEMTREAQKANKALKECLNNRDPDNPDPEHERELLIHALATQYFVYGHATGQWNYNVPSTRHSQDIKHFVQDHQHRYQQQHQRESSQAA